ncbi:MAG: YrbL family protein [Pseudomonadota bacterium]
MLKLVHTKPLFVGGTRYCFQHPHHANRCIKVLRPDRTGEARKQRRKDFKRFLPPRFLDDQRKEINAYEELMLNASEDLWRHVPRYHGTEDTDMGLGIVTQLLRNHDEQWPSNLRDLFLAPPETKLLRGIDEFLTAVRDLRILSRDLLAHNIIAVDEGERYRVMLVDGIGNAELLPLSSWSDFFAQQKVRRKISRFERRYAQHLLVNS